MKIFITFSIFAMISAGVYGIVDMSRDVFQGTMINYRQSELDLLKQNEPVVEVTNKNVTEAGTFGHAGITANSSGEQLVSYVMKSYSRGEPVQVKVVKKKSKKEDSTALAQQNRAVGEQMIAMEPVKNVQGK